MTDLTKRPGPSRAVLPRGEAVLVALALIVSCTYFFTGGGWNQASHFDLIRALVERRTVCIDAYHENTGDKSQRDGHYYTNKAPGTAFLAAPFVAATRAILRTTSVNPDGEAGLRVQARVAVFFCATLPTVAAAWVILALAVRLGATPRAAAFGALMFGLGTPAWLYGASLWAHALSTACLSLAFAAAVALREPGSSRRDLLLGAAAGLAGAWAALAEFQAAVAAVMLFAFALAGVWSGGPGRVLRAAAAMAAGTLLPAALLAAYNHAAFGSPFRLSYGAVVNYADGHQQGFMGVTYPKPDALFGLLFGPQRGLFLFSPVLLAAPLGLWRLWTIPGRRMIAAAAAAVFAYYLLFNAAYFCWTGGSCFGPRLMLGSLPFLALGLPAAWDFLGPTGKRILLGLGATSVAVMLVAISTHPTPSESLEAPLRQVLLPSFLEGRLSLNREDAFTTRNPCPAFNEGENLGLQGLASLAPLLAAWAALWTAWAWSDRRVPLSVRDAEHARTDEQPAR